MNHLMTGRCAHFFVAATLLLMTWPPTALAAADIYVGAMNHYIEPLRSTAVKQIRNIGDATAYVRVDVVETDDKGVVQEKPETSAAPVDGLLASPARLIIPAGGSQSVRMIALGERDRERYFRVRFVPVSPNVEHGFTAADEVNARREEPASASISVLVGYGVRVVAAPREAAFATRIEPDVTSVAIRNEGSSSIYLRERKVCVGNACRSEPDERIAPGQSTDLTAVDGEQHRFQLAEGSSRRDVVVGNTSQPFKPFTQ